MREVFLKPFELAVKEGKTTAIMTSFNRVGGTWTGASHALMTDLLRTEWGFRGMSITDLFMTGNNEWWMSLEQGVRAGQDLWLTLFVTPGELQIDETNPTAQQAMRESIHHIAYTVAQCEVSPEEPQPNWFYHIALPIDIVWFVGMVVYLIFIIRKTKKEKAGAAQPGKEPVSHSPDRLDQFRTGRIVLDLLPKFIHMDRNRGHVAYRFHPPVPVKEAFSCKYNIRMLCKKGQDLKLP